MQSIAALVQTSDDYANVDSLGQSLQELFEEYGITLNKIVPPGARVLVKPNFVLHENQSGAGLDCVITSPNLVLALLSQLARTKASAVVVAEAPLQGCRFEEIVTADFRQAAKEALRREQSLEIVDLRRTVFKGSAVGEGTEQNLRGQEHYALFDLGPESLLEAVTSAKNPFRITQYDPAALGRTHGPGRHQYLIAKEIFAADVIFNLPKLKTHRKAGITGALKNLVGINGNKEYLPHHRLGGAAAGGDCYPGIAPLKRGAEYLLDRANERIGKPLGQWMRSGSGALTWLHSALPRWPILSRYSDGSPELEGGWYGNDTVWRMVLDLNRIALYGRIDGTMASKPQRQIWSLTDAIVCGQGEGPLAPQPLRLGALTLSDSSLTAELLNAALLRLAPQRIPLLQQATKRFSYPLLPAGAQCVFRFQGQVCDRAALARSVGKNAGPPRLWVGHCEDLAARKVDASQ